MDAKPRRAKVKLTRTVTEIALVLLDRDGNVEEYEETFDELVDNIEVLSIQCSRCRRTTRGLIRLRPLAVFSR